MKSAINVIPAGIGFLLLFMKVITPAFRADFWFWISIGSFLLSIVMQIGQERRQMRAYRCRECRRLLWSPVALQCDDPPGQAIPNDGQSLMFYCGECDIYWDVGLQR